MIVAVTVGAVKAAREAFGILGPGEADLNWGVGSTRRCGLCDRVVVSCKFLPNVPGAAFWIHE